jgi:hypothetical protein
MEANYLTRDQIYDRLYSRIDGVLNHAKAKGDGVLADKMRKIKIDVTKLKMNEAEPQLTKEME